MLNKFVLFFILLISAVFISGCVTNEVAGSDIIPKSNLPVGFTYMGIHDGAEVDFGSTVINATEGVYRNNGNDFYIQVIKNENPQALIALYKEKYKDANYSPFEAVSVNGHNATKITDYSQTTTGQEPYYTIMWANEDNLIIVGSPTADAQTVMALAAATGH